MPRAEHPCHPSNAQLLVNVGIVESPGRHIQGRSQVVMPGGGGVQYDKGGASIKKHLKKEKTWNIN